MLLSYLSEVKYLHCHFDRSENLFVILEIFRTYALNMANVVVIASE